MREIDAQAFEEDHVKSKLPGKWAWIDIKVRNIFCEGIRVGTLKYATRFDYHRCRTNQINDSIVGNKCSRYIRET